MASSKNLVYRNKIKFFFGDFKQDIAIITGARGSTLAVMRSMPFSHHLEFIVEKVIRAGESFDIRIYSISRGGLID